VAPGYNDGAREALAARPNLRLIVHPALDAAADRSGLSARGLLAVDYLGSLRSAGGAVLVTAPDTQPDDPAGWAVATSRPPTGDERRDLDLAWRLVRGAVSNAIVLVRDGMLVGLGSGQVSRVDASRQAVDKARQFQGEAGARGAVAASDAFFPFADGPRLLLDAGVAAIVQPGGSVRDAEVLAAVEAAGAAMLVTGTRHFRH
jgi:phosphoribosylaminoimidazolecarboxamide formyltransferase/IMP cyclohydrolase